MPAPLLPYPIHIAPSNPRVAAGGSLTFQATGGSRSGYVFSNVDTPSGGSGVHPSTGVYTAGSIYNVIDRIMVTDSQGNEREREIEVHPPTFTLASLVQRCKERTDLVNSTFISDSEWKDWINSSYTELYDRLVTAYGNNYNVADDPFVFQTDGLTEKYPLPPDFYKVLGVDVQISGRWFPLREFAYADRGQFSSPVQAFYNGITNLKYRVDGRNLWVLPIASAGQFVRVLYVPTITRLVNDTDVIGGVTGWEEYVILDVCIKAKTKREEDASIFAAAKQGMGQRIDAVAENRNAGEPGVVVDARSLEEGGC